MEMFRSPLPLVKLMVMGIFMRIYKKESNHIILEKQLMIIFGQFMEMDYKNWFLYINMIKFEIVGY